MRHINWRNLALLLIALTCWLAFTLRSGLSTFWSVVGCGVLGATSSIAGFPIVTFDETNQ